MNKIILIGNLTKDPESASTPNGIAYCKFSIAVKREFSNADGERETDFFNITVWRTQAENCARFLKKGNKVAVEGKVQNRTYTADDGTKRTVTEIITDRVEFLSQKQDEVTSERFPRPSLAETDDDLPF